MRRGGRLKEVSQFLVFYISLPFAFLALVGRVAWDLSEMFFEELFPD
jgi:hypothetical protein